MNAKIKKHFSLFMVSKSIQKPNKKKKTHTSELILQQTSASLLEAETIPKFLDPFNCYHLFGDICFSKTNQSDELGILSNYNHFKRIISIKIEPYYISLSIEKICDEIQSWEFLIARLNSLNNKDAHELSQIYSVISEGQKAIKSEKLPACTSQSPQKNSEITYHLFCNQIEEFCLKNRESFYSIFKYRIFSLEKGLELTEIRHSIKTMEFFAGDAQTFSNLVVNQGILEIWSVEESDYFSFMKDSITNYLCESQNIKMQAKTMEGFKVQFTATPFRKVFMDDEINEIVCVIKYEIDEQKMEYIEGKRNDSKKKIKGSYREFQLDQMLSLYYDNYVEKDDFRKKDDIFEGYEYNNAYYSEKKRCGIKLLNEDKAK